MRTPISISSSQLTIVAILLVVTAASPLKSTVTLRSIYKDHFLIGAAVGWGHLLGRDT